MFLEIGCSLGEVSSYLKTNDGHCSGWLDGRLFASPLARRRVIGWLTARVLQGLVVFFLRAGQELLEAELLAVVRRAIATSCPLMLVASSEACSHSFRLLRAEILQLARSRSLVVSPCRFQIGARKTHENLVVLALNCGFGFDDAKRCSCRGVRAPVRQQEARIRVGSVLAEKLALWMMAGSDRLEQSRLWHLAS